tara:strand:- start:263 stop:466 length:204 start_codon:yes stop_codon:yes gene_type:complete
MKFKYVGIISTVCVVEDRLIQVNTGDIVELKKAPSSDFRRLSSPPKVIKKKKVIKNAPGTQTSSLGQ